MGLAKTLAIFCSTLLYRTQLQLTDGVLCSLKASVTTSVNTTGMTVQFSSRFDIKLNQSTVLCLQFHELLNSRGEATVGTTASTLRVQRSSRIETNLNFADT